ncbi:4-(cytidine 5'-diphospho)-2-C-methyl-D-erythritol kinase [Planctomycetota bacterium]
MIGKTQFENIGGGLLVRAPAKINLSLLVGPLREDGFHEIETLMAKVNFYDEILIEPGLKGGIELVCEGPEWAPKGEDNLVEQAAQMLLNCCGQLADVKITLRKYIPAGSGLGSASSDAAAVLIGLNEYLQLGLTRGELKKTAVKLGSDIPFFLGDSLSFCHGRGEKTRKIQKKFDFDAILVLPDVSVSTKKAYANYAYNGELYKKLSSRIRGLIEKNRIDLVTKMCTNMLELSCFSLYKELKEVKKKIESLEIGPVCLSGSGSSMFCILAHIGRNECEKDKCKLDEKMGCKSIIVSNNRW